MLALAVSALYFSSHGGLQVPPAQFDIKPRVLGTASGGRVEFADGGALELVGVSDLKDPLGQVWDASGKLLDRQRAELFWKILDDRPPEMQEQRLLDRRSSEEYVREVYGEDKEGRTVAMAFRLTGGPTMVNDVRADVNRTFVPNAANIRPASGSGNEAYFGVMRIVKPVLPKDSKETTFDFRFEVPGGAWTKIVEFPFGPDTKLLDGKIDAVMRYQNFSDFKTVDGVERVVRYKGYFFTLTLPDELRDTDLEIVTNDPSADAKLLPDIVSQHILGEEQDKELKGKDLFLVYGLPEHSAERKFTLRARPKRIAEFKAIPFKK